MKKELIAAILLLAKSMGAYADEQAPKRLSEIPKDIQHCILLAADPSVRDSLALALDQDCIQNLSDVQKKILIEAVSPKNITTMGGPLIAQ